MSFNSILQTGLGEIEYRLRITGLDYEFVTNKLMEKNHIGDGGETIKRRVGLKREGFRLSERAIIPECKIELDGNSFVIVDVDQQATRAFRRQASRTGYMLATRMRDTDTSIWMTSRGFSNGSIIWIGSEAMLITSDMSPTIDGGAIYQVTRGVLGTRPTYHYTINDLIKTVNPMVQNVPFGIENQRVYLYAYGKGDDLKGDGTLIWKGIVIQDASFDGMDWRLEAGPITEVLKGDFGYDSDQLKFRGIHIPSYFQVTFERLVDHESDSALDEKITIRIGPDARFGNPRYPSFFETKEDFVMELNNQVLLEMNRAGYAWGGETPQFQFDERGHLTAKYSSDRTDPRWIRMLAVPDNVANNSLAFRGDEDRTRYTYPKRRTGGGGYQVPVDPIIGFPLVSGGETYYLNFQDLFPEQFTYLVQGIQQVYLNSSGLVFSGFANGMRLYNSDDEVLFGSSVLSYSTTDSRLEISVPPIILNRVPGESVNGSYVIINNNHSLLAFREFFAPATTLPGFLRDLVNLSPQFGAQGIMPLFYEDDFDLDDIEREFNSYALPTPIKVRAYKIVRPSQTFEEYLTEELKLYGCYPTTNLNGQITIRRFREISPSERKQHVLNQENILTDKSFPVLITNKDGIWNSIEIKTVWDSFKEEHLGPTYTLNDIDSASKLQGKIKTIKIAPFSEEAYGSSIMQLAWAEYLYPLLDRSISFIREKYEVVSVEVPMNFFSSSIGDTVSIRSKQLPSMFTLEGDNFRGQSVFNGFIVGRSFDLDSGFGRLDCFVCNESIPADAINVFLPAPITAVAAPVIPYITGSIADDIIEVIVDDFRSKLTGGNSYFDLIGVGDRVDFVEWDNSSPSSVPGIIDSVGMVGNDLVVRVSGSWSSSLTDNPFDWRLGFSSYDESTTTSNQAQFAFVDDATKSQNIEVPIGNLNRRLKI